MGNVTSDNVINLAERSTSQTLSISLKGASANDTVKLYMDGVLVGTNTLSSGDVSAQNTSFTLAANAWGADGERVLTSTIQRGSGSLQAAPAARYVSVAADYAHWSAASTNGSSNVLWFDPETLSLTSNVGQGSAASAGTNDYIASVGGARAYAPSAVAQPTVVISANGRLMLSMNGSNSLRMTVPDATVPNANSSFYYVGAGNSFSASGGFRWLAAMGLGNPAFSSPNGIVVGQAVGSLYTGFFKTIYMTSANVVSTFVNQSVGYLGTQGSGTSQAGQAIVNSAVVNSATFGTITISNKTDAKWVGYIGATVNGAEYYLGLIGDTIYITDAVKLAWRQEVDAYIGRKFNTVGSTVSATSNAVLLSGISTNGVYDLSGSQVSAIIIDQILDLRASSTASVKVLTAGSDWVATGSGNDTVHVKDLNFRQIDAGQGADTLVLDSTYSGSNTLVLADFVSNSRGISGVAVDDARVNAAGFHKLMGFEQIDLSQSTAAQSITISKSDVSQLANVDSNNVTDTNAHTLGVVLGSGDTITTTGFASNSGAWGYYTFNTTVYDQKWTDTNGLTGNSLETIILYARGTNISSVTPAGFGLVSSASSGNDTLTGTSGNDILQGGQGNDNLTGGLGADIFRFIKGELGLDTVTDFSKTQGDKIDLSGILQGSGFDLAINLTSFLQLSNDSSGNAVLRIDTYGESNFSSPSVIVTFSNAVSSGLTTPSLATLFGERVIVA